jgi:hypothetical protein
MKCCCNSKTKRGLPRLVFILTMTSTARSKEQAKSSVRLSEDEDEDGTCGSVGTTCSTLQ